jgi:hypothetical protein
MPEQPDDPEHVLARRIVTEFPSEVFTDGDREYFTASVDDAVAAVAALLAELGRLRAQVATVRDFCAERSGFITAINNCHPDNVADYHRWQGHAEARRQLSERLGLPTAWPADYQKAGS